MANAGAEVVCVSSGSVTYSMWTNTTRLLLCALLGIALVRDQQKPTIITEVRVDRAAPAATLAAAVRSAPAIALVTVLSSRLFQPPNGATIRTVYAVRVDDVIKPQTMLTGFVDVYRVGGEIDEGAHINKYVEVGFPPYVLNRQYVLFMNFNTYFEMFQPTGGPDASYEINASGQVVPMGPSLLAQAQRGKSASAFVAELKAIVQGAP